MANETLNEYCLRTRKQHWVQLNEHDRKVAYDLHRGSYGFINDLFGRNTGLGDIFGFKG